MKRATFGRTWWGEQWLGALHKIDYSNRLPRGRRYANNGSVQDLTVNQGEIKARVKGSRRQPYKVSLQVPPLKAQQTRQLIDTIADDPALLAGLLNRQLDPAVLERAQKEGVPVFPGSWQELQMGCSCPDWAVPCKHLAAAIYLLTREIDADPFLVFRLRGIDLLAALRERGHHIAEGDGTDEPPGLAAALSISSSAKPPQETAADPGALAELDFSQLPERVEAIPDALPQEPPVGGLNSYRKLWRTQMRRVARHAQRALAETARSDAQGHEGQLDTLTLTPEDRPTLVLDAEDDLRIDGCSSAAEIADLIELLSPLDAERVADLQPEVAALHAAYRTALHLTAAGAAVPWVLTVSGGSTSVLWMPASLDQQVKNLLQTLAAGTPDSLIQLTESAADSRLDRLTRGRLLCGLFMDYWIREGSELSDSARNDAVANLLFGGGCARLTDPGQAGTAASLHNWLRWLHLAESAQTLTLRIDEPEPEAFELSIEVGEDPDSSGGAGAGTQNGTRPHRPLAEVLAEGGQGHSSLLRTTAMLADAYPPLREYLRDSARKPLALTLEEIPQLLFEVLPTLQLLGVRTLLPRALERLGRPPSATMKLTSSSSEGSGHLSANDLFRFDWQVAVGNSIVDPETFEELVAGATGLVRFRGQYVYLDPQQIERLRRHLANPPKVDGAELTRVALTGEYAGNPVELDESAKERVAALHQEIERPQPPTLAAELRPYQHRGFQWLYGNVRAGLGCVIADDMGLGKTVQVLALLAQLHDEGELAQRPALIVVPTSLLSNWLREIEQFAPTLSATIYHGAQRSLPDKEEPPQIVLTTYGVARSDATRLRRRAWRVLVADEAQNLKNPQATQTKAVKSLSAGTRVAMSGTPVENRLAEYWSLMDFCNPGFLGPLKRFTRDYITPIQTHGDQQAAARFRQITAPFLMRRLKTDRSIITDLPEKIEQDQYCQLTPEQSALYESVVREGLEVIHGTSDTFQRQGLVLQMILALKQICNHPRQYLKEGDSASEASGKMQRLLELLEPIHHRHEKAIIFTQFREAGSLLQDAVAATTGRSPAFLHGGLSRNQRDEIVNRFQNDRTERVLVLSLKAAGTGLNLTAASHVIHFDLWWNPAVEAQATDRAYRIGQSQTVQVHRLLTQGTFEERINDMIQSKRALTEMTVESGEQWIGNLDDTQLSQIFSLSNS
ncbi:helicase [Halorhodospira halochloris]|uniref:Helicase n=1 Tax=Halorhodospira halochloris TaxID=1052 RepID=A0A120MZU4_HALHR|nr:SNF2-related protein [Halorhodospira halochloris]MBK1652500.1 helicase SNF2 [Halorhodospira halochloris]BAU57821.1 helicase [Halorhodospira halochloris]